MRRITFALVGVAMLANAGAHGAPRPPVTVTSTGSQYSGLYAPSILAIPAGAPLLFVQSDPLKVHDVVSLDRTPEGFPLFETGRLLPFGEFVDVRGVPDLQPGGPYVFTCTVHEWMLGELFVVPEPA